MEKRYNNYQEFRDSMVDSKKPKNMEELIDKIDLLCEKLDRLIEKLNINTTRR